MTSGAVLSNGGIKAALEPEDVEDLGHRYLVTQFTRVFQGELAGGLDDEVLKFPERTGS